MQIGRSRTGAGKIIADARSENQHGSAPPPPTHKFIHSLNFIFQTLNCTPRCNILIFILNVLNNQGRVIIN